MNPGSAKTKIVCTIGPASESPTTMKQLMEAGMSVARLNFSHGSFEGHGQVIENLRAVARSLDRRIAIMADLPGPKMRIGRIEEEPIELEPGNIFVLTTDEERGDRNRVSVSFADLPKRVKTGDRLFLNDGYIEIEVHRVTGNDVVCVVRAGGELRSGKGLNLPGIDLGIGAFTPRDFECLKFALENGVDAVSQSFVERAADVEAVRNAASGLGYQPFIIAKIERSAALQHIEEIMDATDGIMIARGDLGVEIPIEQMALVQKRLIRLANRRAKPVITATQMLEAMTDSRRPTRAEVTDVSNAIFDGTDCVMLSAESAIGRYPVEAVAMLTKIAKATEEYRPKMPPEGMSERTEGTGKLRPEHLINFGVHECLTRSTPAAIFIATRSGSAARDVARFRLPVWVMAVSPRETTCQNLQFSSGIYPIYEPQLPESWSEYVQKWANALGFGGGFVFVAEGPSPRHAEVNQRLEIIDLDRGGRPSVPLQQDAAKDIDRGEDT